MSLAIYSLTLSIILSTAYSVVYSFTKFEIRYFDIMYMIIAFIYIVAAIMIMKEGNKTAGEAVTVDGQIIKTQDEDVEETVDEKNEKKKKKLPDDTDKEKEKEKIPEDDSENKKNSEGDK